MKPIKELIPLIENWAKEKGLLVPENAPKQYLKFLEEVGETAHEILHENWDKAKLEFGDIAVTAIIMYRQLNKQSIGSQTIRPQYSEQHKAPLHHFDGILETPCPDYIGTSFLLFLADITRAYDLDLTECLNLAWDKIKNRTGKTKNGTFIKDKP